MSWISRLTISAGEDKDLIQILLLSANGFGEPVKVNGVNFFWQFNHQTCLVGQQVPLQDLVVLTARVQLVCCGPANATHKLFKWSVVKGNQISAADELHHVTLM